jgi:hypothetical protein
MANPRSSATALSCADVGAFTVSFVMALPPPEMGHSR